MKLILAGLLFLVVAAFSDAGSVCQPPQQFSGSFATFIYSISQGRLQQAVYGDMIYDAPNLRLRVDGLDPHGNKYVLLQYYEERQQYILSKGQCYIMPFKGDFQRFEIPSNATLANEGLVGIPPNTLYVKRYFGEMHGAKFLATVTRDGCMLTSSVAAAHDTIVDVSMTGVSLGAEPSKFTKPEGCKHIGARRRRRSTGGILDNPENFGW